MPAQYQKAHVIYPIILDFLSMQLLSHYKNLRRRNESAMSYPSALNCRGDQQ